MDCLICNKKIGMLKEVRINEGYVCKDCSNKIPEFIKKEIRDYDIYRIHEIIDYFSEQNKQTFEITASYGDLCIDEMHGLLGVKNKEKIDILNALDISNINLVSTDIKADNNDKVKCNVELICELEYPQIYIKTYIKKNVSCQSKRIDRNNIEWTLPGDLGIIKAIIFQTIENAVARYNKKLNTPDGISKHTLDIIRAKALYMIEEYYDHDILLEQRNRLAKMYHTDNNNINNDIYMKKINYYYNILKNELEG